VRQDKYLKDFIALSIGCDLINAFLRLQPAQTNDRMLRRISFEIISRMKGPDWKTIGEESSLKFDLEGSGQSAPVA
jgi:hypothetical protein